MFSVTFRRDQHCPLLAAVETCWSSMCPLKPPEHDGSREEDLYRTNTTLTYLSLNLLTNPKVELKISLLEIYRSL